MARKLRVQYPGALYHVMSRGDRREPIFKDDPDRERFLDTLGEACAKTRWQVHAYCLMGHHFHLVVETPRGNLVAGMKWLLGACTSRFNRRHKLFGHLFGGRYKALVVDGSGNGYLKTVCDYVHLNPARAKLVTPEQALEDHPWSSYPAFLRPPGQRPAWLRVDRLLGEHGIPRDSAAGRRELARRMEQQRLEPDAPEWKQIRRGWCLGDQEFRAELLEQMGARLGRHHGGGERRETEAARAERLVAEELERRGWGGKELARRRKGDRQKVGLARRLRGETTMTLDWIAERLNMGTAGHLANCLRPAKPE